MRDKEVLKQRGKQYGPMAPMWEAIGAMQWENFKFLLQKSRSDFPVIDQDPSPEELGHLAAMNMTVVKMVRSIQDPKHNDNYVDGRNYNTIADIVGNGKKE